MVNIIDESLRVWDFRCVDEKDKPVAIGFGLMLMSLFAFVPSPILFGIILGEWCTSITISFDTVRFR